MKTSHQGLLFGADYSPVAPSTERAVAMRDAALVSVEQRAEREEPGFAERAKKFVVEYLREHGSAPGEQITDACIAAGIQPGELRAFGPVYMSLSRSGVIVKVGLCQRKRGHGTSGGNIWALAD
jgi:hypothetical protein